MEATPPGYRMWRVDAENWCEGELGSWQEFTCGEGHCVGSAVFLVGLLLVEGVRYVGKRQ